MEGKQPAKPPPIKGRNRSGASSSSGGGSSNNNTNWEAAEEDLFATIEARRGRVRTASGEVYRTAVAGERPLLAGNVGLEQMYNIYNNEQLDTSARSGDKKDDKKDSPDIQTSSNRPPPPRFKEIVKKVMKQQQQGQQNTSTFTGVVKEAMLRNRKAKERKHKRSNTSNLLEVLGSVQEESDSARRSTASSFFQAAGGIEPELGKSEFAVQKTQVDRLVCDAMKVEQLLEGTEEESIASSRENESARDEQLPLLDNTVPDQIETINYDTTTLTTPTIRQTWREQRVIRRRSAWYRKVARKVSRCCHPAKWYLFIKNMILNMHYAAIALIFFILAIIFYYYFGNPHFDFMPGPATLSWWCNFSGRQLLTLELARATQYILIDWLVLSSKYTVQFLGPLVTLWALQAKGWPLITISWGCWDLLLLHGDNAFQSHWLYWTGIAIYSKANSGSYILSSPLYLRFLLSLILAGAMTSLKRALVAINFGRRTFAEFKPRLERILKEIVLVNEVADLAEEAERITVEREEDYGVGTDRPRKTAAKMLGASVTWEDESTRSLQDDPGNLSPEMGRPQGLERRSSSTDSLSRSPSGSFRIKDLLDRWEEPINKLEKTTDASISDILRFRRALSFMDDDRPFGDSFGEASTRDACIESAHHVYTRLLRLDPQSHVLSNDVLALLTQEDDGTINVSKQSAMRRIFRPDRFDQLPMLAFIQAIDTLYRNLRYFRASVGNASVIDHALEQMLDGAFAFLLFLLILTILDINVWPILVSMSTLLVSFSFGLGSSASKYIEGVLLISVRRPYDLGDRIVFNASDLVQNPGAGSAWLVQDINLYTTTLRFALTNEVATVANGTIAASRIVNLNRSPNAICLIDIVMHICIIENDSIEVYKTAIEKYIADHPRIWESLVEFRYNSFDSDNEACSLRIRVRHRNSWSETPRINRDWGEFQRFMYKLGETMGVDFDSPPPRRLLYQGGSIKIGSVPDYKKNLFKAANIKSLAEKEPEATDTLPREHKDVTDALFLAQLRTANDV